MRLPVVMAHKVVNEGQCIDFLAQPPLWSGEDSVWRSSHQPPFYNIEINTKREVTPNDERQSYSNVAVRIAANVRVGSVFAVQRALRRHAVMLQCMRRESAKSRQCTR